MDDWKPSVTVAAVVERGGRFLLVEEIAEGRQVYNQPAGHWERGETLVDACTRETLEETAHAFVPRQLTGIYRWEYRKPGTAAGSNTGNSFLRFAFCGDVGERDATRSLDTEILRAVWLTIDEIRALQPRHRSPLVMRCIEDYLAGRRYPLDLLTHLD
jgi:ADP-ribose pyrophosphatase YjhB (NUDIX family)